MSLLAFANVGRYGNEGIHDENEIIDRIPGVAIQSRNDDLLSNYLFTVQELGFFYNNNGDWSKEASRIMINWVSVILE